jgi:ubiquitin-protein ligase E3 C
MTPTQQRKTLKFVTSLSRAPLLGFGHMSPPFNIAVVHGDKDRLPSAATCSCTLKLPVYEDEQAARDKILKAIEGTNSFEFS